MKSILILCLTIAITFIIIDAAVVKQNRRRKRQGDKDTGADETPEYVLSCYREGRECCDSFEEKCHSNSECGQNEVCCLANCTVQCFPVNQLGKTPEKALEDGSIDENDILDSDPDFIRFPTNADLKVKVNRTECFPRTESCCYYYFKECHDNSDCEDNETCCEEDCGSMCYPSDKLGQRIYSDEEEADEEEGNTDLSKPLMITASKALDGSLTIVVKPVTIA